MPTASTTVGAIVSGLPLLFPELQQFAGLAVQRLAQLIERVVAFDAMGARVLQDRVEALAVHVRLGGDGARPEPSCLEGGFELPVGRHEPNNGTVTHY